MKRGGALEGYVVSAVASGVAALVGVLGGLAFHLAHLGVPAMACLMMAPALAAAVTWRALERRRLVRALRTGGFVYTFGILVILSGGPTHWWESIVMALLGGAAVGAFARGCATDRRRGSERPTFVPASRRAVVIAGSVLLVVSVVATWVTISMLLSIRDMGKNAFAAPRPPADKIVCTKTMSDACAREAADRAGGTVAWLPGANGFTLEYVVAVSGGSTRQGFAFEHFSTGDGGVYLELISGQLPSLGDAAGSAHITIDGRPVTMQTTKGPGDALMAIELDWEVDGRSYSLSVGPQGLFSEVTLDQAQMTALYRQIRYTEPTSAKSGGGP